jgi:hypothetical protein
VALSSGVEIIRDNYELETEKKREKKGIFLKKNGNKMTKNKGNDG